MRGHRLLFVLASLVALGLIGFANFPGDRDAVADIEASQLVGGGCGNYQLLPCVGTCPMQNRISQNAGECGSGDPINKTTCCGGGASCGAAYFGCTED